MSRTKDPNVSEHAVALRRALAVSGVTQDAVANALGIHKRTVVNWMSRTQPTMPSEVHQEQLNRLFPGYANQGDPVEAAIMNSELPAFRRSKVLAAYQEQLHEMAREAAGLAN
jgi:hypothetical protein